MNSNNFLKCLRVGLTVFALLTVAAGLSFVFTGQGANTVLAQQDPFLNNRINQIERQFNSIETRISRLEQQSRFPGVAPQTSLNRDAEFNQMRSQVESLQFRIDALECGLVKLDERTLTTTAKQARRKANPNETDRCRLDSNIPLQFIKP
jgi:chaperonin cofactor prefoldin